MKKDSQEPSGYTLQSVYRYDAGDVTQTQLLLPDVAAVKSVLDDLKRQACAAERDHKKTLQLDPETETPNSPDNAGKESVSCSHSDPDARMLLSKREIDTEAIRAMLFERESKDAAASDGLVRVYAWDEPLKLIAAMKTATDPDLKQRNKEVLIRLVTSGNRRRVAMSRPAHQSKQILQPVRDAHPHFKNVIDYVEQQLALAFARNLPMRIPAILLYGPPGVGKTHFTHDLASTLQTHLVRQSFDASVNASSLTGSDSHWGNTSHGLIFEAIVLGDIANPIVMLDEIDKATSSHLGDPLAPLHSLLEPISSGHVRDISFNFEIDASLISWIATANDRWQVPPPIRSRFVEFRIDSPTGANALQVAKAVVGAVHKTMNLKGFQMPDPKLVKLVAHLGPREQRQALEQAYASAISKDRLHIVPGDFADDVLENGHDEIGRTPKKDPDQLH